MNLLAEQEASKPPSWDNRAGIALSRAGRSSVLFPIKLKHQLCGLKELSRDLSSLQELDWH